MNPLGAAPQIGVSVMVAMSIHLHVTWMTGHLEMQNGTTILLTPRASGEFETFQVAMITLLVGQLQGFQFTSFQRNQNRGTSIPMQLAPGLSRAKPVQFWDLHINSTNRFQSFWFFCQKGTVGLPEKTYKLGKMLLNFSSNGRKTHPL